MSDREAAWDAVHEALPARWTVGQASIGDPLTRRWSVTARGPHPGRGKVPQTVTGTGEDEAAARATWTIGFAAFRSPTVRGWTSCALGSGSPTSMAPRSGAGRNEGRGLTAEEL